MKTRIPFCVVASGILSLVGCSSEPSRPAVYPVTGTVTQGGKPVDGAQVFFVPKDPKLQTAAAITDADGKYALTTFSQGDGAQPGNYGIKVLKYDGKAPPPPAGQDQRFVSYEDEQKNYVENTKPVPPPKNLLPKKYEGEDRSGLSHTVPEGPSTFDIKIE